MRDMDQYSATGDTGSAEATAASAGPDLTDPPEHAGRTAPAEGVPGPESASPAADAGDHAGGHGGTAQAWAALGGDPVLLARVSRVRRPELLPSVLPTLELATSSVTACSLAAAEFSCVRARSTHLPSVRVDDGAVAAAFHSERHLHIDGRVPRTFAPLSRFWPVSDGWVRTHGNYPHHRAALLSALGLDGGGEGAAPDTRVAAEMAQRKATEVEESVFAADGLAVAVRTPAQWAAHPQRAAVTSAPLVASSRLDSAAPLPIEGPGGPGGLQGLRVLDLTRVLAGPVATRTLALLGADVLRIDPPHRPELADTHADTDAGKRSALLDLASRAGQAAFEELLASAHVVVTGYRPGALDRFGLAPESLADRRPGLVVGQLCAWGFSGPWQRRRGFDSLVQAAVGIARTGTDDGIEPGALPAQALDHGTGYLLAGALLRALTEQRTGTGGSRLVRLSLARTAHWLTHELCDGAHAAPGDPEQAGAAFDPGPWMSGAVSPLGRLRHVRSPVGFGPAEPGAPESAHSPVDWTRPPGLPGADTPVWL